MPTKAEYDAALALAEETDDATACERSGINPNTLRGERLRRKRQASRVPRDLPDRPSDPGDREAELWKAHDEAQTEVRRAKASIEACRKEGAASDARAWANVAREAFTRQRQLVEEAHAEREHRLRVEAAEARLSAKTTALIGEMLSDVFRLLRLPDAWKDSDSGIGALLDHVIREQTSRATGRTPSALIEVARAEVIEALRLDLGLPGPEEMTDEEQDAATERVVHAALARFNGYDDGQRGPLAEVEGPNAHAEAATKPESAPNTGDPQESRGAPLQFADRVSEPAEATAPRRENLDLERPEPDNPLEPRIGGQRAHMREVRPGDRGSLRDRNPSFRRFD